ncbi:MAG: response regulator [Planctomycetaceae bacterium]|jgi:PAS domain S-box-containing protein|nr:response regulator [Planctomycetaceae bacterium]
MTDIFDKKAIDIIQQVLAGRSVPAPPEMPESTDEESAAAIKAYLQLFSDLAQIRELMKQFANGDFDGSISIRGSVAGYLKTLQAHLRHLSWQVEQIAAGDFSQRVDFMGDFSRSFNSMVEQLKMSLTELKEREARLIALNENLEVEIRQRKTAEASLLASEQRFNLAVQCSGDGIWDVNLETKEAWYSDRFIELFNFTPDDLPRDLRWDLRVHPDHKDEIALLRGIFGHEITPQTFKVECRMKNHSGNYLWVRVRGMPVADDSGMPRRMIGVMTDISSQKELEKALAIRERQKADEHLQNMIKVTPFCCHFWNKQLENIDCNLATEKLFGVESSSEFAERFHELSPERQPDGSVSIDAFRNKLSETFRKGETVFEWQHRKTDGELIPTIVTLACIKRGEQDAVIGFTQDISELKKAQDALEKERLLLLNVLNTSPVSMAILVDGVVRFVTPFMRNFLGIDIGESILAFFQSQSYGERLMSELFNKETIHWRSVSMKTKSGERKEMQANMFQTWFYDEDAVMVWLIDVTKVRKTEAELKKARDTAEELARVKTNFLANMSHEIRTPINAILGLMHVVQQTELTSVQQNYIVTTEDSAKALLQIVNDILDFSDIETGKLVIGSEAFAVRRAVEEAIASIVPAIEAKNLTLTFNIDLNVPEVLVGDQRRLKQVIVNLMSNAVKFTTEGSINISVQLEDETNGDEVTLLFSVRDTGVGMTEKQINQIFSPFTQADSSTTRKYGGTGLGLTLCKNLVDMMDGTIWCESEVGKGAAFFFTVVMTVPKQTGVKEKGAAGKTGTGVEETANAEQSEQDANQPQQPTEIEIPENIRSLPILLTDDNKINQLVATQLLKLKGFSVDVANNGKEAIEKIQSKNYGIILMDIQMPEMDGLQAAKLIRQDERFVNLPIIAMTAHASETDKEKSLAAGMNDHITKPIDPVILYKSIIKWVSATIASRLE